MHKLTHLSKIRLQKFQQTTEYTEKKGNELDSSQQDYLGKCNLQFNPTITTEHKEETDLDIADRGNRRVQKTLLENFKISKFPLSNYHIRQNLSIFTNFDVSYYIAEPSELSV